MLEVINFFSTLYDLLILAGVFLIAYGQGALGIVLIVSGLMIMYGKGEILVHIK